jgi:uncharacterized membrane protein YeaQ/YmgE (transglycosylase-associated protein family)
MHLSSESLLITLLVGLVAGWLAGKIVQETGFGIIGDMAIGIAGAFVRDWLMPRLGIQLSFGIVSAIINATIGAIVLLLIIRLIRGGGRLNSGSGTGLEPPLGWSLVAATPNRSVGESCANLAQLRS